MYCRLVQADHQLRLAVHKTLTLLSLFPPAHPSLWMKKVRGTDKVCECSVNMDVRITFEFGMESYYETLIIII
jgi:mRNA interferase RelE/StbE